MRNKAFLGLLLLAAALLAAAFLFARWGEERIAGGRGVSVPVVKSVEYPRDRARRQRRSPPGVAAPTPVPMPASRPADRLTRALASPGRDGAIVVEVNAIRHSPLVEKVLACETARRGDTVGGLAQLEEELGVDLTEDVDRVAFDKDVLVVSGFFDGLKLPAELGPGAAVGDAGRIFRVKDDTGRAMFIGRVGDDLLLTGFDEDQVRGAIDRAEGRGDAGGGFPEGVVGGEVYGVIGRAFLQDLLSDVKDPAVARLVEVVTETRLQMAVDDDAALSLDLSARTPEEGRDLAKALGGAVSMMRVKAQRDGDVELAGLLEQARVVPRDDGGVAFDFAVPGDDILRLLGCDPAGRPVGDGDTVDKGDAQQ